MIPVKMANETSNNRQFEFPENGSFVKRGTVILEAEPFVAVLSSKFRDRLCDNCFSSEKISRCSGCRYVRYCGKKCQKKSWALHKVECPNLKRVDREIPDAARMMARLIIKLNDGGDKERGYYSTDRYRTFQDLMSHYSDITEDMTKMKHFTTLVCVLREFLPRQTLPSPKEMLHIFGRMSINSFHILDTKMTSVGVGIYLGPSVIDHSCRPNVSAIFHSTKLTIRTTRDIPSFDWNNVSVAYIDLLKSADERREELMSTYYFWCDCERCLNPEPESVAAACPNKKCTSPCLPSKHLACTRCEQNFSQDFQEKFEMQMSRTLRYLDKIKKMESLEELEICRMLLQENEGLLHPLNLLHGRFLEAAMGLAHKFKLWQEAEVYARKTLLQFEHYYGESHPLTGCTYLTFAEILLCAGKPMEACRYHAKASEVIRDSFGAHHPKMREIYSSDPV